MSAETAGSSLLVLPVYARFLTFEAWQCVVWGVFFFWSSYYDVSHQVPLTLARNPGPNADPDPGPNPDPDPDPGP